MKDIKELKTMQKALLNISNINVTIHFKQDEINKLKDNQRKSRQEFLQAFIDDCLNRENCLKLVYNYAVELNYGMDVNIYESDILFEYSKKYIKYVYKINVDVVEYDEIIFNY